VRVELAAADVVVVEAGAARVKLRTARQEARMLRAFIF